MKTYRCSTVAEFCNFIGELEADVRTDGTKCGTEVVSVGFKSHFHNGQPEVEQISNGAYSDLVDEAVSKYLEGHEAMA